MNQQSTCLNSIQQKRNAGICYACSGRAENYFTSGKLNIHETQCRGVISKCFSSWYYLLAFLERVNLFYKASTKLQRKLGVNFNKAMSSSPASDVLNWVSETKLMRKLIGCKKGLCDFKTAKEICEGFISFDKPIYLHQALKIVNVLISKINTKKIATKNKKKSTEKAQKVESFSESVSKDAKKANQYYEQLDLDRILSSIQRFMTAKDKKLFRILVNASQKTATQKKLF